MKLRIEFAIAALLLLLGGCASAPQAPVALSPAKVSSASVKIGVAIAPIPKPDTFFPGADCLLCVAAASLANTTLTKHVQTLAVSDLQETRNEVGALLKKKGAAVTLINEPLMVNDLPSARGEGPNIARKDFTMLAAKYGIEKLVVIQFNQVGVVRTYAAYFPTSVPKATLAGAGMMINLADNSYDWYAPFIHQRVAPGEWDEPEKFPGITNAFYQAVEAAKDDMKKPFVE